MRRVGASGELDRPIREEEDGRLEAGSERARRCRDEVALQSRKSGEASRWNLVLRVAVLAEGVECPECGGTKAAKALRPAVGEATAETAEHIEGEAPAGRDLAEVAVALGGSGGGATALVNPPSGEAPTRPPSQ